MADGVSDDGSGGEPLILASPTGRTDATRFTDAMDEEVEILEHEQMISAKIICTAGVKTTGKWSGQIIEQGMDSHGLGQWRYIRIYGKNGREVLMVTAYQACKASIGTIGSKTEFAQ